MKQENIDLIPRDEPSVDFIPIAGLIVAFKRIGLRHERRKYLLETRSRDSFPTGIEELIKDNKYLTKLSFANLGYTALAVAASVGGSYLLNR